MYDQPALATAIDIRTSVKAERLKNDKFEVKSDRVGSMQGRIGREDGEISILDKSGELESLQFVSKVVELTLNTLERSEGIRLSISSDLPMGSGLGSSSAVNTATAAAVSSVLGDKLPREGVAQIAFEAERKIQGVASRTGVNVATYGGFLRVQGDEKENIRRLPELDIIIGYTGEYGDTGKLVRKVKNLREGRPTILEPIMKTIGKCTQEGIEALRKSDFRKVEVLMNANQNLLEGLRVSSRELRQLISAAREAGAPGAKLTGGGGGGCMIALCPKKDGDISEAIRNSGGKPIKAKIGAGGLKY